MKMIDKELSEPYSVYTYRHFLDSWANLCFLVLIYEAIFYIEIFNSYIFIYLLKRPYIKPKSLELLLVKSKLDNLEKEVINIKHINFKQINLY